MSVIEALLKWKTRGQQPYPSGCQSKGIGDFISSLKGEYNKQSGKI